MIAYPLCIISPPPQKQGTCAWLILSMWECRVHEQALKEKSKTELRWETNRVMSIWTGEGERPLCKGLFKQEK